MKINYSSGNSFPQEAQASLLRLSQTSVDWSVWDAFVEFVSPI